MRADPKRLRQILLNLLSNAVKFCSPNVGRVVVSLRQEAETLRVDVRDNGPGVPEKARAHLFQAFQGSARKGGTGLGLAVAHELVTAHGGSIRLMPTDRGTHFRIEIADRAG